MPTRRPPDAAQSARSARPPATPVEVKPASQAAAPVKKSATGASAQAATAVPVVSADERRALIARAAYLRGESRGFPPGGEAQDWLAAEQEVDALLGGSYRADH